MKRFVFILFLFPAITFSQEIEFGGAYFLPRLGYSHHFRVPKNTGFVGFDYVSKPDYVGSNLFAGVNLTESNNRLKVIPEIGGSMYLLFFSTGFSFTTESFQPMVGIGLFNYARLEGGYSFRFRENTPFQGFFIRFYVNNFLQGIKK